MFTKRTHVLISSVFVLVCFSAIIVSTPSFADDPCPFQVWSEIPGGGRTPSSPATIVFNPLNPYDYSVQHFFVRGEDDTIQDNFFDYVSGWSGWHEIPGGGRTNAGPFAILFETPTSTLSLWLLVRGVDNTIQNNVLSYHGWSGWREIPGGGGTPSGPAAAVYNNALHVFVRGMDDTIQDNVLFGGVWSGWHEIPGGGLTPSSPSPAVYNNALHVFVRGMDDTIQDNVLFGGVWSGWHEIPGGGRIPSQPAAVASWDGLNVLVRGVDDTIQNNIMSLQGGWTGWGEINGGGRTPSGPGAANYGDFPEVDVVVRGEDDTIQLNYCREIP